MFPVALGAKGHPPDPPKLDSRPITPSSIPAHALAIPVLRVLCKWSLTFMLGKEAFIAFS